MAYVLVACEESQVVCKAFRDKGHVAYSCDIQDCSGGHPEWKKTCLWLKGLTKLRPTNIVLPNMVILSNGKTDCAWHYHSISSPDRSKIRSKTFQGLALAMAEQWSDLI